MAHRAIDCPFSWYQHPATHLYAEASDANANNQPVNPDNPADEQTNIVNEDSPALIADPDGTPDSLADFTAPASALSASGTSSSSSGSSSSATDISNDDSHLSEPSQASGLLDPEGFIVSSDASIVCQSHGPSVLMSDLAISDEDGECLSDTRDPLSSADPLLSSQLAWPIRLLRKKIGGCTPAKLSSSDMPPLHQATAPNLITPRRLITASRSSQDSSMDTSDAPEKRKELPSNS